MVPKGIESNVNLPFECLDIVGHHSLRCRTMRPFASLKLGEMLMQKMNATKASFAVGYLSS